jgi:hypothetical protein
MSKNENGLTRQQQGFCDSLRSYPEKPAYRAYLENFATNSEAAARASASKLLTNPNIARYLGLKQALAEEKADYDQEQWVRDLIRLKEMCMAERDITLIAETMDKDGNINRVELAKRGFDPSGANKALDTLGKFKKWLAPVSTPRGNDPDVTVTNGVIFVGADGFGGYVGEDGVYVNPKQIKAYAESD